MKLLICVSVFLLVMADRVSAKEWIYVYENGEPVGYSVGSDFEFYEVAESDIEAGNAELLAQITTYSPHYADVGYGSTEYNKENEAAEHYGRRKGGLLASNVSVTDWLSPGDWQAVYGDYYDPGTAYLELDKSGPHWSFDSSSFYRFGYVYGVDGTAFQRDQRRRRQHEFTWRRGSMDGGVWKLKGLAYEINGDGETAQARDLKLKQLGVEFRAVECNLVVEGQAYAGKYLSKRADMRNEYLGAQLDGSYWLSEQLQLNIDGSLVSIDAAQQDGEVTRSNAAAGLAWEMADGLTLSASLRAVNEESDIAANSRLKGYQDSTARLEYRQSSAINCAVDLRHREMDTERLKLEDDAIFAVLYTDPPPGRVELQGFREPGSASSDKLSLSSQLKLSDNCSLSANYQQEQFDSLPSVGNFTSESVVAPYFADESAQGSLAVRFELPAGGNFSLRAEQNRRENSARTASYESNRYALGYSSNLARQLRWNIGVSRNEDDIVLEGESTDFTGGNWNYHVSMCGEQKWADYRFTYASNIIDGAYGAYDSLGMELTLQDIPIYITAWWRERGETLGGLGTFADSGVNLGYHFVVR